MEKKLRSLTETEIVQNPVIGAYALWRFALSYQGRIETPVILPLAFLILPIVLHRSTLDIVLATQKASGLALFSGKLGEKRENLLALHERARVMRPLTLESLIVGEQAKLLSIHTETGTLRGNNLEEGGKLPPIPERVKWMPPSCEKLGYWFAGVTDYQIARMLNVEF